MPRYTLADKLAALEAITERGFDLDTVSRLQGIPPRTLRRWYQDRHAIQREATRDTMLRLQAQLAETALDVVQAMDPQRIADAPLNQLSAALNALIDRYLKLRDLDDDTDTERVIRFEYKYPDGTVHSTPPWTTADSGGDQSLQGGGVRQTLRQDGTGETHHHGQSRASADEDLVAGTDLSDGESRLARSETDDDAPLRHTDQHR